jgi:hypothetical protein
VQTGSTVALHIQGLQRVTSQHYRIAIPMTRFTSMTRHYLKADQHPARQFLQGTRIVAAVNEHANGLRAH